MRNFKKTTGKHFGFTLMETLVATAIMAILACIAIPAVIVIQRNLHMAKLDDYARQIFMATQNEMSAMKDSGRLDTFAKEIAKIDGRRLEQQPQDFPAETGVEAGSESWRDLFAVSSADAVTQNYLVRADDSLQQATENGGQFWIELNPLSGDVYSVFYAEKGFSYAEVQALADRTRKTRTPPQLGYYGSGSADFGTVGLQESFYPTLEVVNGEELYFTVNCNDMMALRRTQKYLTLTVTITDEHGNSKDFIYHGGTDFSVVNDSITVTDILDSLEDGNSFANKCSGLTPGDDLSITAKLTYQDHNNAVNIEGVTETKLVNSLFFNKDGDKVQVSKVRHLNNLRQAKFPNYEEPANGTDDAASSSPVKITLVEQSSDISFDFADWDPTDYCSPWTKNPLDSFQPISNDTLFTEGTYDGNRLELKAFVFGADGNATPTNSALFSSLTKTTLQNIRLTDCVANGSNAAALAAQINNSTVTNCGVYLHTKDKNGNYYPDMDDRVKQYTVTGTSAAGGLVAIANNTTFTDSFGAINTFGSSNVGGLVGSAQNCTINNSYSSGEVTGNNVVGGLVGKSSTTNIGNCYSTSVVTADGNGGGLLGTAQGGTVSKSTSYGIVYDKDQNEPATSGGFVGTTTSAAYNDCRYLKQAKYNSYATVPAGVTPTAYSALRDTVTHPGESYPYKSALRNLGLPFPLLKQTVQQDGANATQEAENMPHYGNWPEAYQLQNSLVYYEKYSDGTYGYYARTSLVSGGESAGNNWIVDTLRQKADSADEGYATCVEDGYALMTIYTLDHFVYDLDTGAYTKNGETKIPITKKNVNVKIAESDNQNTAKLIAENVSLIFKDGDDNQGQTETTISNAKVYRLPFDLQITSRTNAETFWATLVITGYAGNGQSVFDNETFYYCPDFAKNAVNPEVGTESRKPEEPGGEGNPVYVRSARQLNGMARSIYYWNPSGGRDEKIYFLQETDINFGTYTTTYCGVTYDLMNTSDANPYKNQPIGHPNAEVDTDKRAGNFRNYYDGQCNKIIDYCCDSKLYRFTGLFGETERCVIKNIVMVASNPNAGEFGSGYVRSNFNNGGPKSEMIGVGALAGLFYMEQLANNVSPEQIDPKYKSVIENCSVSGYHVEYYGTDPDSAAVGGLAGFNFCTIKNCSAVSKLVYANESTKEARVGGLVGGLVGIGTIDSSYAGGTLAALGDAKVGGISGGFVDIFGYAKNAAAYRKQSITNCYSYCTIKEENFGRKAGNRLPNHIFGIAVPYINEQYGTPYTNLTVSNCYYLNDPEVLDMTVYTAFSDNSTALTASEINVFNESITSFGNVPSERSFPWSDSLKGHKYPFPGLVTNLYDEPVHYGDWPDCVATDYGPGWNLTKTAYLTYYEQYEDGSYGVYTLGDDNNSLSTLNQEKKITASGYAFLTRKGETFRVGLGDGHNEYHNEFDNPVVGTAIIESFQPYYQLVAANDDLVSAMKAQSSQQWQKTIKVDLMTQDRGTTFTTVYSDPAFAQAVYSIADPATLYLRTQEQLQNTNGQNNSGLGANWAFTLTHDIEVTSDAIGMLNNNAGGSVYDGCYTGIDGQSSKYFRIIGLQKPLFNINSGTVRNLTLTDVKINLTSGNAAAIAVTNNTGATIENCTVQGTIASQNGSTAGMVSTNNGTITNSTFDGSITAKGGDAAGFVNTSVGTITSCTAKVNVTASSWDKMVAGFANTVNGGTITACKVEAMTPTDVDDSTKAATDDKTDSAAQLAQIVGKGNAAGFANTSTATITRCITKVNLKSTGGELAGFVNTPSGGSIASCAVTGIMDFAGRSGATSGNSAGFFSSEVWPTIKDCFTAVTATSQTPKATLVYGFSPIPNNPNLTNCGYITAGSAEYNAQAGTQYYSIDWSKALDENNVPSETGWPDKILVQNSAADTPHSPVVSRVVSTPETADAA